MFASVAFCGVLFASIAFETTSVAQTNGRENALALEQHGQMAAAEDAWRAVASADPQSAEAFAHLGLIAALQQRFDQAISYYIEAFRINSEFPELEMNLGLALFKGGHFKESIEPFTNELRKHQGDPRLTILLGMAHYRMGDYLVAIPFLRHAVDAYPQSQPMRLQLAQSCLWSRQPSCVLDAYRQMVALHLQSADMDMLAGQALDENGDDAAAMQRFRSALEADPKLAFGHFAAGYLLWKQGHFDWAAAEFLAEIGNDPRRTIAHVYLADCYLKLGDRDKAQGELDRLLPATRPSGYGILRCGHYLRWLGSQQGCDPKSTEGYRPRCRRSDSTPGAR